MVETKDIAYVALLTLIGLIAIGSVGYQIYDTGEEVKCRTGDGWTILEEGEGYFKAQCQFKGQEWVTAYCSSFRSTPSYPRYGCNEVVLVKVDNTVTEETVIDNTVTEETIIDNTVVVNNTVVEVIGGGGSSSTTTIINNYPVEEYRGGGSQPGEQWSCPQDKKPCVLIGR